MKTLPDFLIIGAQKAGTSWLHQKLRSHPDIFLPAEKDQAFFFWEEGPHTVPAEQYGKAFAPALDCHAIGEATAAYFWTNSGSKWAVKPDGHCKDVPKRVLTTLGRNSRFILSLRNPVDRAVSAYLHHIANGDLNPEVSLLDAGGFSGLIDMGFYSAHLNNWLRCFPLQQFLVLFYEEDVVKQPRNTLQRVFSFLDVDPDWPVEDPGRVVFQGRQRIWLDNEVWVPLKEYPTAPGSEQRQIEGNVYCRRVDDMTINKLKEIYTQDKLQLQSLLGIDLDSIWSPTA